MLGAGLTVRYSARIFMILGVSKKETKGAGLSWGELRGVILPLSLRVFTPLLISSSLRESSQPPLSTLILVLTILSLIFILGGLRGDSLKKRVGLVVFQRVC